MPEDHKTPRPISWSFSVADDGRTDGTGRRPLIGFAVIAVAVIVMAGVSGSRARTVSGAAVVPPPPQIGDCVTVQEPGTVWEQMNAGAVPALVSGPCVGPRDGEVVSVDNRRAYQQRDCSTPALRYVGLPARNGSDPGSATAWRVRSSVAAYTFGPAPVQVAAGQLWSACVLLGLDTTDFNPSPLTASPRDAATSGGAAFDRFASCTNSLEAQHAIPCDRSHRYEVIADGFELEPSEADSKQTCTDQVSELTGLQDPSANGRLRIEMASYLFDTSVNAPRRTGYQQARAAQGWVTCAVSPAADGVMLTSTLIGLDGRPLPLS